MGNLSQANVEKLKALGIPVRAFDPHELEAVLQGHRTLGELTGITKAQQHEMMKTGLQFLQDGLKEKGQTVFLGLEALDPYDAYVQAVLANIDVEDEKFDEAEERFSKAILINPVSVPALVGRGELRLRLGKKNDGVADLEVALKRGLKDGNESGLARAKALIEAARVQK